MSSAPEPPLPEDDFRLYAVCSRYPHNLASAVSLRPLQEGVYECCRGTDRIQVVVAHQLPRTDNNALLHLLSASPDQVRYGVSHYRQRSAETSTLLDRVFEGYQREGVNMPYTMEDFRREYIRDHLKELSAQERLQGLSPEDRLQGLSPEDRLQGLSPEEVLKALSPEEVLKALSPDQIKKYLERRKKQAAPQKRKKRSR